MHVIRARRHRPSYLEERAPLKRFRYFSPEMAKFSARPCCFLTFDAGECRREKAKSGRPWCVHILPAEGHYDSGGKYECRPVYTSREIVDYVRDKVSTDTKGKQTPVFKCFGCDPNMPLFYSK